MHSLADYNSRIRLVATVLSTYEVWHRNITSDVLSAHATNRQSFMKHVNIDLTSFLFTILPMCWLILWSSYLGQVVVSALGNYDTITIATDHVRQLVTKQLDIVVKMGIQETTYQHKELLWQSFVSLVDIILNGYCEQLSSIKYVVCSM